MVHEIDQWLQVLGDNTGFDGWTKQPKNMAEWCSYLTLDVLGQLCFGASFGMVKEGSMRDIKDVFLDRTMLFLTVCLRLSPRTRATLIKSRSAALLFLVSTNGYRTTLTWKQYSHHKCPKPRLALGPLHQNR